MVGHLNIYALVDGDKFYTSSTELNKRRNIHTETFSNKHSREEKIGHR